MAAKIQEVVDRTPEGVYDAILLGYGLCGNGLHGLTARRAADGQPRTLPGVLQDNPGTYYQSTGWLERGGLYSLGMDTPQG